MICQGNLKRTRNVKEIEIHSFNYIPQFLGDKVSIVGLKRNFNLCHKKCNGKVKCQEKSRKSQVIFT